MRPRKDNSLKNIGRRLKIKVHERTRKQQKRIELEMAPLYKKISPKDDSRFY